MTTITIWLRHIQVRDIMCATILFLVRKSQLRDLTLNASHNDSQFKLKQLHAENGQLLNCVIRWLQQRMWYTIADTGTWDPIASVPGDQSITGTQCMIVMLHAFRYVLQSAISWFIWQAYAWTQTMVCSIFRNPQFKISEYKIWKSLVSILCFCWYCSCQSLCLHKKLGKKY